MSLLEQHQLTYRQKIQCEAMGVHTSNRWGSGVTPSEVHKNIEKSSRWASAWGLHRGALQWSSRQERRAISRSLSIAPWSTTPMDTWLASSPTLCNSSASVVGTQISACGRCKLSASRPWVLPFPRPVRSSEAQAIIRRSSGHHAEANHHLEFLFTCMLFSHTRLQGVAADMIAQGRVPYSHQTPMGNHQEPKHRAEAQAFI